MGRGRDEGQRLGALLSLFLGLLEIFVREHALNRIGGPDGRIEDQLCGFPRLLYGFRDRPRGSLPCRLHDGYLG
jgi:hypothetical protein